MKARVSSFRTAILRAVIMLTALLLAWEARIGCAAEHTLISPDGRYVAFEGKAKDKYHNTIWLRDTRTSEISDLLAPGDESWPGAEGSWILAWLDNTTLLFSLHCGTGCTSLQLINVTTRELRYFCTDGGFFISPDKKYAAGTSDNPYGPEDKRAGLAVIAINTADSFPTQPDGCEATIRGNAGLCDPHDPEKLPVRILDFVQWSQDSKSFTYIMRPCVRGEWRAQEKRVFHLK
jgi:hypothetical protein